MTRPPLEELRKQLRETDRFLLRALDARARFPRHPLPRWPATETRLPPPHLLEILLAIAPAGTADPASDAASRDLIEGLLARQRLGMEIADTKADANPDDYRAAMESGDRDRLLSLLTDLPTEVRLLETIRETVAEAAPSLPPGLAVLLWREYLIPWTKQVEVAHLLRP